MRRTCCRLCAHPELDSVLTLTPTPPANEFVPPERLGEPQRCYPLELFLCRACAHVQLLDVLDPARLFEGYVYVSGTSGVFVRHFESYAGAVLGRTGLGVRKEGGEGRSGREAAGSAPLAVDIGSNDGVLLRAFQRAGLRVLGIDPARDIAAEATSRGVPTWPRFFDAALGREIRDRLGPAHVVTANNVFAHIDDLQGVLAGVRALLAPEGVFVLEFSWLADVVEHGLFDTVYHEHLSYHALAPLLAFFERGGLTIVGAEPVPVHGGSLRVWARRDDAPPAPPGLQALGEGIGRCLAREGALALDDPSTYRRWGERIDAAGEALRERIRRLRDAGWRMAGYGAPAKATTLMYHFGLGREEIELIIDDNPRKQGLHTPGLHVPVLSREVLEPGGILGPGEAPRCLVVLAWNFAASIIEREGEFLRQGGRFLVPLPRLREVAA